MSPSLVVLIAFVTAALTAISVDLVRVVTAPRAEHAAYREVSQSPPLSCDAKVYLHPDANGFVENMAVYCNRRGGKAFQ